MTEPLPTLSYAQVQFGRPSRVPLALQMIDVLYGCVLLVMNFLIMHNTLRRTSRHATLGPQVDLVVILLDAIFSLLLVPLLFLAALRISGPDPARGVRMHWWYI